MKLYQALKIAFTPAWLMLPLVAVNVISLPVNSVVRGIAFDRVHILVLIAGVVGYSLWILSLRLFTGIMISFYWRKNQDLPKIAMVALGLVFIVIGWFLSMPILFTYGPK